MTANPGSFRISVLVQRLLTVFLSHAVTPSHQKAIERSGPSLDELRQLAAAQATGKTCVVLDLPGIAVDVDNPEDLRQLVESVGETRSQRLARQYFPLGTIDGLGG